MKTSDFHFDLPDTLIAQTPLHQRTESRLLHLDRQSQAINHKIFKQIEDLLHPGDCLVLNNTKVIPARLYGQKASGGKIECLLERILDDHRVLAHIKSSKSPKPGSMLCFEQIVHAKVLGREGHLFELEFLGDQTVFEILEAHGHIPLPPYITRAPDQDDLSRYQTVFAQHKGAVAAPTAGLHFDDALLSRLRAKGVDIATVTLHVGAGTFMPVKVESLDDHVMHSEVMQLDQAACDAIAQCRARQGRVVAVGTTVVRCLETVAQQGAVKPYTGETRLFITPGFKFQCVNAMLTNFHLPESTLLMLVSAFAGYDFVMEAYAAAVREQYRFFSYGDAMFIG